MAKTFNQFKKKIDELYWPKAGDEAKFMAMHGPYAAADVGGPETHDDAVFKGTIVQKDHTKLAPSSEELPDGQSELNDLIKNIHSRATDELLKTVSHLNLSTDPKHREHRDVINKELMYRYKNHSVNEELKGNQHKIDADGDKRITPKDFAILRARKNKKMNEELGFKPTKITVEPHPEGHHAVAHGPGGQKKNITQFPVGISSARSAAADAAKDHGLTADKNKPYGSHFAEETELDEGKFGNAMAKFTDKSKAPFVSKLIHGIQTGQAARAAKKSKADPDNFDKLMNYANARNKVREETELDEISPELADAASRRARSKSAELGMSGGSTTAMRAYSQQANRLSDAADKKRAAIKAASERAAAQKSDTAGLSSGKLAKLQKEEEVEEGYVSVNGQRVGPRRQPMSFAQRVAARGGERTPEQKAATEKALKDIEDKMSAKFTPDYMKKAADNAAAERKRQVDAEKAKRGIKESAVKNPYAVGTAAAEKSTGDRPPLEKSTVNKAHKIAKAIMRKESVNFNTEEIELEDGNVIEIDIELAEAIADLFDSLDEDDQDALAEMLHSNIDSFMEIVDLLENDGE